MTGNVTASNRPQPGRKDFRSRFGGLRRANRRATALLMLVSAMAIGPAYADEKDLGVAEFEGTVVPAREAEITPIVSAWLKTIAFAPGELVEEGQILFEFAKPPAEYRLQLAQGQLEAARATLREAEADVARSETLKQRNVVSEVELEKVIAQRDVAAANVSQAEANVGLGELGVMQMTQKAPFAGVMSAPMVRENGWQDVTDGDITMAIVTQLDPIHVRGEVPYEVYAARQRSFESDAELIDGLTFSVILPDGELYAHEGRLVSGGYTFEPDTQKVTVWVAFPNPDLFLRPGLRVRLRSTVKPD